MKRIKKRNKDKIAVLLLVTAFFLIAQKVEASVLITEVMYDLEGADTGREWIEITNTGGPLDISKVKFFDGSNHVLNAPPKNGGVGNLLLESGSIAIIASDPSKFLSDNPSFSGTVIDTTMSLPNTSATIAILDESGATLHSINYSKDDGAAGDGNSLHFLTDGVQSNIPSPGIISSLSHVENEDEPEEESAPERDDESDEEERSSGFYVDAGGDRAVVSGGATIFSAKHVGATRPRFVWNFGDGEVLRGQSVVHSFLYPGVYIVTVKAIAGGNSDTDMIVVRALSSPVTISSLGRSVDKYIELKNTSSDSIDISLWSLRSGDAVWTIPSGTNISKKSKLIFSSRRTGLLPSADERISLVFPNGEVADTRQASELVFNEPKLNSKEIDLLSRGIQDERWTGENGASAGEVYTYDSFIETVDEYDDINSSIVISAEQKEPSYEQFPRDKRDGFFTPDLLKWFLFLSGALGLIIFFIFYIGLGRTSPPDIAIPDEGSLDANEFHIEEELL